MKTLSAMLVVGLLCAGTVRAAEKKEEQEAKTTPRKLAVRVFKLTDLILDNHIDPPTRQEMILRGIKSMYRLVGQKAPANLSRRISRVVKPADLAPLVNQLPKTLNRSDKQLAGAFTQGLLASVAGRPYLISQEQVRINGTLAANQYVGTGIVLRLHPKFGPMMPKVFYNGPAWKAGAKSGDIIISIDGDKARKMPLQTVLRRLRGTAGSEVVVEVRRPKSDQVRKLKITRNVAFIPSVEGFDQPTAGKWNYLTGKNKDIAYLRINRIGSSTQFELRKIAAQLGKRKLAGLILDLRFGGGSLHETILLANALLHKGVIGHIQSAEKRTTHTAKPGALFHDVPMAVLVQRNSNGDRLFLTAALQDNQRAKVVGESTQSDSFVRQPIPIPGGEFAIIMPTAILQRGNGLALMAPRWQRYELARAKYLKQPIPGGIVPDIKVELSTKELGYLQRAYSYTTPGLKKPLRDRQLAKAIEILQQHS